MKKTLIAVAALAMYVGAACAAKPAPVQSDWLLISTYGKHAAIWVQRGSGKWATTEDKETVYVGNFQTKMEDGELIYSRKYIKEAYCTQGFGEITTVKMTGDFVISQDFNIKGGRVVDMIAVTLCAAIDEYNRKAAEKAAAPKVSL